MQKLLTILLNLAILAFVWAFVGTIEALAQDPENPFVPGTTSSKVFSWYTVVYSGIVTALTYLQAAFFPKAGSVPKVAVRYLIIAGVTAAIFITLGLTDGFGVFFGFIGSALTYDKVLVPLGIKTPTPK